MNTDPKRREETILALVAEYARERHAAMQPGAAADAAFVPGETPVPYAGRVFGAEEVTAAVAAVLDFWLTLGPEGDKMEAALAAFLGVRKSLLVNSGSSANLVALSALTSSKLPAAKRIVPGDEVITCAAGFPTTVAPMIQIGAVPVFIDNDPVTGNPIVSMLEAAYARGRTKAVMFAHTLGNPFDLATVVAFCRERDLWLVEDNCDALGSLYSMPDAEAERIGFSPKQLEANRSRGTGRITLPTGSWGDLSTQSFYPPHHITMGEGGAVNVVRDLKLKVYAESFRDWGRDCWCPSGVANTCGKRFEWQLGELPEGYDHKYIYSHLGYNLKPLDVQAAIGRAQLARLPGFIEARKENWKHLRRGLADLEHVLEFSLPTHATGWTGSNFRWDASQHETDPSWFGFQVLVRKGAPFTRTELARHLDQKKIGNRMLFGGNLVRQPAFVQLRRDRPDAFRVIGDLAGTDRLMHDAVFIGTYPGLTHAMLDYVIEVVHEFVRKR